jgi:hypothetical protein
MKYFIIGLLALVTGCASLGVPEADTNAKKLVVAETSLQELSRFALDSQDRLSTDTKAKVKELILGAHKALVAARAALLIGDSVDFTNHLTIASGLIATLRPILLELEQANVSFYTYHSA